jgi:hypothetical protein
LVTSAGELIRIVRCGLSDSIAQDLVLDHAEVRVALKLLTDRPRKPCISRTTDSQESSSAAVSHTEARRRENPGALNLTGSLDTSCHSDRRRPPSGQVNDLFSRRCQ